MRSGSRKSYTRNIKYYDFTPAGVQGSKNASLDRCTYIFPFAQLSETVTPMYVDRVTEHMLEWGLEWQMQ